NALNDMQSIAKELGFTPASRIRMDKNKGEGGNSGGGKPDDPETEGMITYKGMRSVDNGLKKQVDDKYLTDDYYFDEKEAINFKKFAEKLWLPEGLPGQLIVLMAFQLKIAIEILAIKRVKDGTRRFREVFITMPRKNAKSFLVALIILYLFFTDKQRGQQNIIVANSRDQAANVYDMIEYMIKHIKTLM